MLAELYILIGVGVSVCVWRTCLSRIMFAYVGASIAVLREVVVFLLFFLVGFYMNFLFLLRFFLYGLLGVVCV